MLSWLYEVQVKYSMLLLCINVTKMILSVKLNVSIYFLLVDFTNRFPAFGDSFGLEFESHCARPLLYETEPHQLRL